MMNLVVFISVISQQLQQQVTGESLSQWLPAALVTITAFVTNKQFRRQKRKLVVQFLKEKLFTSKKRKLEHPGLFIVALILIAACFGLAIALGMLKEFLVLIGVFLVLFFLLVAAAKRS